MKLCTGKGRFWLKCLGMIGRNLPIYDSYIDSCSEACKKTLSIEYMLAKAGKANDLSSYKLGSNSISFLNGIKNFYNKKYPEAIPGLYPYH